MRARAGPRPTTWRDVYQATKASGVDFLGVNIRDEPGRGARRSQRGRVTYPSLFDPAEQAGARRSSVPPNSTPATLDPRPAGPDRVAMRRGDASVSELQPLRRAGRRRGVADGRDVRRASPRSGPLLLAIGVAALAGLVSFLSPCVLPLVPGYLSYVTGLAGADLDDRAGRGARQRRAATGEGRVLAGTRAASSSASPSSSRCSRSSSPASAGRCSTHQRDAGDRGRAC